MLRHAAMPSDVKLCSGPAPRTSSMDQRHGPAPQIGTMDRRHGPATGSPWAACSLGHLLVIASEGHFSYRFVRCRDLPGPYAGKWLPEATSHIDLHVGWTFLGHLLGNRLPILRLPRSADFNTHPHVFTYSLHAPCLHRIFGAALEAHFPRKNTRVC